MIVRTSRKGVKALLLSTILATAGATSSSLILSSPALAHGGISYVELAEQAKPAVVTVKSTMKDGAATELPDIGKLPEGPMGEMFRKFLEQNRGGERPRNPAQGLGSGFIIDPSGVIVTNNHVIDGASEVIVTLEDGEEFTAEIVGTDEKTDLAILKIMVDRALPALNWADSDDVRIGEAAIAIGNPFGLGGTVTAGIVSGRGRNINAGPYDDFLQVDTAINRGNSGGPLFDSDGKVIGVSTMIYSPTGGNVGLGFAIPSNQAKMIAAKILEHGHVERGRIGVAIQGVTDEIAEALGLDGDKGALVSHVEEGSPASAAKLTSGDVILRFGEAEIDDVRALTRAVAAIGPGTEQSIKIWRDGGEVVLPITVGAMPKAEQHASLTPPTEKEGVSIDTLGASIVAAESGVAVADIENGAAGAKAGLREGDVIVSINQEPVESVAAAVAALQGGARETALLLIAREGRKHFIAVPLDAV